VQWLGGSKQKLNSLERPRIFFGEDGKPEYLLAAADEGADRAHSYNLRIPLK
jgi:hypothetical protein